MEFSWIVYFIGVIASIMLGLRGIGCFTDNVKYRIGDIAFVLITSFVFSWFGATVFYFGYGKPQQSHPDVI